MVVSAACLSALKVREGCRLQAYLDAGNVWTIGYGHTDGVYDGQVITQDQAELFLVRDSAWVLQCIQDSVKVDLTDNQFGALFSFVYNIGCEAFKTSTLLRLLNVKDYVDVPAQMSRWNKVDGILNQGLVSRRTSEIAQWNDIEQI
jgi:lysozyme